VAAPLPLDWKGFRESALIMGDIGTEWLGPENVQLRASRPDHKVLTNANFDTIKSPFSGGNMRFQYPWSREWSRYSYILVSLPSGTLVATGIKRRKAETLPRNRRIPRTFV
jgi:hypothetical protein